MVSGDGGLQLLPVDRPEIPAAAAELSNQTDMDRYQEEIRRVAAKSGIVVGNNIARGVYVSVEYHQMQMQLVPGTTEYSNMYGNDMIPRYQSYFVISNFQAALERQRHLVAWILVLLVVQVGRRRLRRPRKLHGRRQRGAGQDGVPTEGQPAQLVQHAQQPAGQQQDHGVQGRGFGGRAK